MCVGDLYLNMNEYNKKIIDFKRLYNMHGLFYVLDLFTRQTQDSQTKIDVVLTNTHKGKSEMPATSRRKNYRS